MHGIVNINKPRGLSSFKAASRIKNISGSNKAGHAGTLDLEAEGVLLILLNEACKAFDIFLHVDKTYMATIRLGWESTTGCNAGEIRKITDVNFKEDEIRDALNSFKGKYIHRVPEYSAKKHHGKTFYSIKRKGKVPPVRMQETRIHDIKTAGFNNPDLLVEINCSSGTYIRTLATDISERLGCPGYLERLTRTGINGFTITDSVPPDKDWMNGFTDLDKALRNFPHVVINKTSANMIKNGTCFREDDIISTTGAIGNNIFSVYSPDGKLIALACKNPEGSIKLKRVFSHWI